MFFLWKIEIEMKIKKTNTNANRVRNIHNRGLKTNAKSNKKRSKNNELCKSFFRDLPQILDCIGALISFLREREFKVKIDSNMLDKYYNIFKQEEADPLIIIGTCKYFIG